MKAVIRLDVPDWQIGQEATVYFPDSMMKKAVCNIDQGVSEAELEGGGSTWWFVCGECHRAVDTQDKYCRECGRRIIWV